MLTRVDTWMCAHDDYRMLTQLQMQSKLLQLPNMYLSNDRNLH